MSACKNFFPYKQFKTSLSNASFASWSTYVLPWIPIWLVVHVKMSCLRYQQGFPFFFSSFLLKEICPFKALLEKVS
jgi:hypothetical protein